IACATRPGAGEYAPVKPAEATPGASTPALAASTSAPAPTPTPVPEAPPPAPFVTPTPEVLAALAERDAGPRSRVILGERTTARTAPDGPPIGARPPGAWPMGPMH